MKPTAVYKDNLMVFTCDSPEKAKKYIIDDMFNHLFSNLANGKVKKGNLFREFKSWKQDIMSDDAEHVITVHFMDINWTIRDL